jgi:D-alanyl-D-alanine carboxypeptidase
VITWMPSPKLPDCNATTHTPSSDITRNHDHWEDQFDQSVHIDQKVCPFWLKVWGMKNTCYIWPVHSTIVTFLTKS